MHVVHRAVLVVLAVHDALRPGVPVDIDVRVFGIRVCQAFQSGFVVCIRETDEVRVLTQRTVEDVHEDDLRAVLPCGQSLFAGFLQEAHVLVERAVELSDVRGVEISEGHAAGVVVRAAFQDHDVEVRHVLNVVPLPVREVLVGTVTDFQVLVVVDAVVDDSRVVRHQDRAADSTVVDTGAGLLSHSLRDSVVHGGRSVGRTDDQGVSHKEDFLALQLVLPEAETGVISALLRDGGVAFGGLLPAHGLDRDELRARLFQDAHGLVLLDVPGLGVRSAAGAAALRFHGSGSAQVGRVAFGVVVAVVDVVLERVRHVLEGQLIVEGSLFQTDDARSIQFERTADIVVRRIRFAFR